MNETVLTEVELESRDFLLQWWEALAEFWEKISWLRDCWDLPYITNPESFKTALFESLNLDITSSIKPYMLTTNDKRREYVWGVLAFTGKTPEKFLNNNNETIKKQLESEKYAFITCLQVREVLRPGTSYGKQIFSQALENIFEEYPNFRGVISDPRLVRYYQRLGIEILNDMNNEDGVCIGIGNEKTFKRCH